MIFARTRKTWKMLLKKYLAFWGTLKGVKCFVSPIWTSLTPCRASKLWTQKWTWEWREKKHWLLHKLSNKKFWFRANTWTSQSLRHSWMNSWSNSPRGRNKLRPYNKVCTRDSTSQTTTSTIRDSNWEQWCTQLSIWLISFIDMDFKRWPCAMKTFSFHPMTKLLTPPNSPLWKTWVCSRSLQIWLRERRQMHKWPRSLILCEIWSCFLHGLVNLTKSSFWNPRLRNLKTKRKVRQNKRNKLSWKFLRWTNSQMLYGSCLKDLARFNQKRRRKVRSKNGPYKLSTILYRTPCLNKPTKNTFKGNQGRKQPKFIRKLQLKWEV